MQRRGARPKFAARISTKVFDRNFSKINLGKAQRLTFARWLSLVVDVVNENGHPLISSAVCINRTSALARGFDFNAFSPGLDGIVWINAFN